MNRMNRSNRAERGAQDSGVGIDRQDDAARPTFESWLIRAKRGQVIAVYVDGVELSRAAWEADGYRIHLRAPFAQTAVTAAVRRGGACFVVEAEPAGPAIAGLAR